MPATTTRIALRTQKATSIPQKEIKPTSTNALKATDPPTERLLPSPTKGSNPSLTLENEIDFRFCSPLEEHTIEDMPGIVSSPYDPPPMGKDDRHQGVDFVYYNQGQRDSIEGEGVQAIMAGWVALVIENRLPYGNMVIIETPANNLLIEITYNLNIRPAESIYHLYAHFQDAPVVLPGSWIECGQLIGFAGKSGYNIPVPHLHLETRIGPSGTRFDGMAFYDTQANEAEMENYTIWRMSGKFSHFDPMMLFLFDQNGTERVIDEK